MNPKIVSHILKNITIKISTQYSWGLGYIDIKHNIIITNEHVVRAHKVVCIIDERQNKHKVKVLYIDKTFDLAFLECPPSLYNERVTIELEVLMSENLKVYSWDYLTHSILEGQIDYDNNPSNEIKYFKLKENNSDKLVNGPIVNEWGKFLGLHVQNFSKESLNNCFVTSVYIQNSINNFLNGKGKLGVKCPSCSKEVNKNGSSETIISLGIIRIIEEVIISLGYDAQLVQQGVNNWVLVRGSSSLNISYVEKNGIIMADAYLCIIPEDNIDAIYTFLLQQNNILNGISFSVVSEKIILSLIVFEQHLNVPTLKNMIGNLLVQADKYDNILVEKFGASWRPVYA